MITTFQVTAQDISAGIKRNANRCPVALAMKRALGEEDITVGTTYVCIGPAANKPLPDAVQAFIGAFDAGEAVQPFIFLLEIP